MLRGTWVVRFLALDLCATCVMRAQQVRQLGFTNNDGYGRGQMDPEIPHSWDGLCYRGVPPAMSHMM